MLLALLVPAARAEAWETAEDIFLGQLNDDIRRNDSAAHLYTGCDRVEGLYEAFYCPDGCFAIVHADGDDGAITRVELFCEDAGCVRRRLDDVAYLAYCFGSRDSIEAVSAWCDEWCEPIRDALDSQTPTEADTCECPAFDANMCVCENDAEFCWLRITLELRE